MPSNQISELPLEEQYTQTIDGTELLKQSKRESARRSFWAFLLPMLIIFFAFAIQEASPFGERHILTVDLYHQYAPFLVNFRDKLLNGGSFFFSWSGGLGVNFYALLSYYLASPLNFLYALVPEALLSDFVLFLVVVKVGLAGLSFHLFLKKCFKRDGPLALAFSAAYALSGYTMAYFFNIMWLDTLYFLPLLSLSLLLLMRENVYAPYIICLALTLMSNFYSGYFASLFIFFFFFVLLEREEHKDFKQNLRIFLRVGISTIFAIALSAILLYPTYQAMTLTSAVGDSFPEKMSMLFPGIDFLSRFMPLAPVTIRDGMANIYSGIIVLPLLLSFFMAKSVSAKRKAINLAVMIFLLLSFNLNYLDFIWHGFHFPNQLPYRNSFVFVFFILYLAYDGLPYIKELNRNLLYASSAVLILSLFILQKLDVENYGHISLLVTIFFLVAYTAILGKISHHNRPMHPAYYSLEERSKKKHFLKISSVLLCSLIIAELIVNSFVSIHRVEDAEYFGLREGYAAGKEADAIYNMVDKLHAEVDNDLCRIEILPDRTVGDSMLYRTNGFSIFASTFPEQTVAYLGLLGYPNNGINSFQYMGSTPIMDAIFGLDYQIYRGTDYYLDNQHELVYEDEYINVLKSKNALPIAFLTNIPSTAEWQILGESKEEEKNEYISNNTPFREQELLFNMLTGEYGSQMFEEVELREVPADHVGVQIQDLQSTYEVTRTGTNVAKMVFEGIIEEPGDYYFYWNMSKLGIDEVKLEKVSDRNFKIGRKPNGFTEVGRHEKGSHLKFTIDLNTSKDQQNTGTFKMGLVKLNEENFQAGLAKLREKKAEILAFGDDYLSMRTAEERDSVLFFSTTANPGWKAYLDGREVPIKIMRDSFLVVDVPRGEHELNFRFTPPGFESAKLISMVAGGALLLFAIMDIIFSLIKKREQEEALRASAQTVPDMSIDPTLAAGWPQHFKEQEADTAEDSENLDEIEPEVENLDEEEQEEE